MATYADGIQWQRIPEQVRHQASLNILDTIGCMASGATDVDAQRLLRVEAARGGHAQATVIGSAMRLPMDAAARVNAYMGDIYELNDLIGGHASMAVVTPSLALAAAIGASGRERVEAVVAGVEVVCRVHGGFYAHQKPFTETGTVQCTIAPPLALRLPRPSCCGWMKCRRRTRWPWLAH